MSTITETACLRKAFLKIGWAPIITICGSIVSSIIGIYLGINTIYDYSHGFGVAKIIMILTSLTALAGYILSYSGFNRAQKIFGNTKAGNAFASLKTIFLIYVIIGSLFLLITALTPTSPLPYIDNVNKIDADVRDWAATGLLLSATYILTAVFSIIALFVVMSRTKTIASTTNINSLKGAAKGAKYGVYCFFGALAAGIISASVNSATFIAIFRIILLVFAIYALVRWVGGWLGAANEVTLHEVEADDNKASSTTDIA